MFRSKIVLIFTFTAFLFSVSCKKDPDNPVDPGSTGSDTLRGSITENRTLLGNRVYYISGPVFVKNGITLTVEAGTILKAIKGTRAVLVISRGGKINAQGTVAKPIVFTSNQVKGQRNSGDWGGLVLLGKATTNAEYGGQAGLRIVEGFTSDDITTFGNDIVGGGGTTPDDNDNSGILTFVRIEYAGIALSNLANSELNSLTMIGVGKGTKIDNVQCSLGGDDSFEWFGGTVDAKHLVAFRGLDDDFDSDNGFSGRIQFGVSIRDKDIDDKALSGGASNGFESDNDEPGSDKTPLTSAVFSNMTLIGPAAINTGAVPSNAVFRRAAHLRRNTSISIFNSVLIGWPDGIFIDGDKAIANATAGRMELRNNFIVATGRRIIAPPALLTTLMEPARGNDTGKTAAELKLAKITDVNESASNKYNNIDARPIAGSPLLGKVSGTIFTNPKVTDAFFTKVGYIGAFEANDSWMQGWTNFDPQNADY